MTVRVESQQLGAVEIPDDSIIRFPTGIPGFCQARRFCLLTVKPGSRFRLLQAVDHPDLAFVVIDPLLIDPVYPLELVQRYSERIGLIADEAPGVAAIVTVPSPPGQMTANLAAPLVMGLSTRLGAQIVLHDSPYSVRHPL